MFTNILLQGADFFKALEETESQEKILNARFDVLVDEYNLVLEKLNQHIKKFGDRPNYITPFTCRELQIAENMRKLCNKYFSIYSKLASGLLANNLSPAQTRKILENYTKIPESFRIINDIKRTIEEKIYNWQKLRVTPQGKLVILDKTTLAIEPSKITGAGFGLFFHSNNKNLNIQPGTILGFYPGEHLPESTTKLGAKRHLESDYIYEYYYGKQKIIVDGDPKLLPPYSDPDAPVNIMNTKFDDTTNVFSTLIFEPADLLGKDPDDYIMPRIAMVASTVIGDNDELITEYCDWKNDPESVSLWQKKFRRV